jgi:hypothetical protein
MQDMEESVATCEMCGREEIRYVHEMEHPDHASLRVGCICAEKMADDYVRPRERVAAMTNRAKRRQKWLTRKWRETKTGGFRVTLEGRTALVKFESTYWRAAYVDDEGNWRNATIRFPTIEAAKLAVFDELFPPLTFC